MGAHRPPPAVQRHLIEGLDHWIALLPVSRGSSGLSDAQLDNAVAAWHAWHDARPCPVAR